MQNYAISVDWLQTFNHAEPLCEKSYASSFGELNLKSEDRPTKLFKKCYVLYRGKMPIATILQEPRNSCINARATSLKLHNRVLYCEKYIEWLYEINRLLNLTYKGITRIDLCLDCNELAGGRSVQKFIQNYVTAPPFEVGHIIRNGSSLFRCNGSKKLTSPAKITSIRWGSPKTKVQAYCYDKTLELIEVKDKPWIRDTWRKNGLIFEYDEDELMELSKKNEQLKKKKKQLKNKKKQLKNKNEQLEDEKEITDVYNRKLNYDGFSEFVKKSVWRFELSIKSQGMDLLNMQTGLLYRLSPQYLESQPNIEKLFFIYAGQYLDFRINTGQSQTSKYPKLELFEHHNRISSKPYMLNRKADCGRTEKICYNRISRLAEEYTDCAEVFRHSLIKTLEFLREVAGRKIAYHANVEYLHYLDSLKGQRFLSGFDAKYLRLLNDVRTCKGDLDTDFMYDAIALTDGMSEQDAYECWMNSVNSWNLCNGYPAPDISFL